MDFKSLISKIESIDGVIETPAAPVLAQAVQLNEDAELRVLSGRSTYVAEAKKKQEEDEKMSEDMKVGDTKKSSTGGTIEKTKTGVKHTAKDYDGSDHVEPAKKASKAAMSGAERREQKAADKAEEKKSKDWEKKHGKGSVTRHKMEDVEINAEKFRSKFAQMVEEKKEDDTKKAADEKRKKEEKKKKIAKIMDEGSKPDFLDVDKDGDKKEPMKKASKEADKSDDKKETKGMTAAQKKLPPGLQKAIAKKKGTSESVKTAKKVVAESVEQKLTLKDMLKIVKESGGQQAIDPMDQTLWSWANRVAASKVQESQKAEIFAAMIYERNGGRFEMYDVLSEDQK